MKKIIIPDLETLKKINCNSFLPKFNSEVDADYIINHKQYRQSVLMNQKRKFDINVTSYYCGMHYYISFSLQDDPLLFTEEDKYVWVMNSLHDYFAIKEKFPEIEYSILQELNEWENTEIRTEELCDKDNKYISKPFELNYEEKKENGRIFSPERVVEALNHFKKYLNPDFEINELHFKNAMLDMEYDIENK